MCCYHFNSWDNFPKKYSHSQQHYILKCWCEWWHNAQRQIKMSWIWILLNSMNLIIINIICHRNVNREKCIYVYIIIIFVYVERFHTYHILYAHIKSRQKSIFKQGWFVILFQAIWGWIQYSVAHMFWYIY